MRNLMMGLLGGVALLASCHGGGGGKPDPADVPGTAEFKAVVSEARLARLAAAPAAATAAISGKLTVSGFSIVSEAGAPSAGFGSIFVRVIDPDEDILSLATGQPDSSGVFNLQLASPPPRAVLEVHFKVAGDLDGDGTDGDEVRQRVPLALVPGKTITTDIALRQQTGFQPGAPTPDGVTLPTVIAAVVDTLDADGRHAFSRASDYAGNTLLADVDANGKFDPLVDLSVVDADDDGLDDASFALYNAAAAYDTVFGVVTRVDLFERTVELLVKSGESGYLLNVRIDPQAAVELYLPKAPGGESFAQLNPDQFLVGHGVYVDGFYTDGATQRALTALGVTVLQ